MTMKVHELAKELGINSKDLLEKAGNMGMAVKSHMSALDDTQVATLRNSVSHSNAGNETKIVKVSPKKEDVKDNEPKVVVKKANIPMPVKPAVKTAQTGTTTGARPTGAKMPMGKPVPYKEDPLRQRLPMGKPVASKALDERDAAKAAAAKVIEGTPLPKKDTPEVKAEAPKVEETKVEATIANTIPANEEVKPEVTAKAVETPEKPKRDVRPLPQRILDKKAREAERAARGDNRNGERPRRDGDGYNRDRNDNRGDRDGRGGYNRDRNDNRGDRDSRGGYNRDRNDNRGERNGRGGREGGKFEDRRQGAPQGRTAGGPRREDKPDMGIAKPKRDDFGHSKDKDKEREKNRDHRFEGGKPRKSYGERSLEKAAKPKKHVKKEKIVEEPTINLEELPTGTVIINVPITVAGFCEQTKCSTASAIMALMKMGIMANINQNLDEDTVQILADEVGVPIVIGKVVEDEFEEGIENFEDKEEDLKPRPPIVTVMGHVDHGKTSLLDAIRKTNVTAGESGGITQHIGASEVTINGQKIVFLDTPGHEAFTAMRARGAHSTDIAILVVAADDGVMPQTIESISHAKAAGVPIIVAINKMDKPAANPDRVKQELTEHGILVEDWGGDVITVPVSAKKGDGITNLLEMVLLQAEVLELKANPNRYAMGTVIEARLDKAKGPVATLLVMNGTLKSGMSIVAGTCAGRIRAMSNFKGDEIVKAGPATAVEILGLDEVPEAGDEFNAVKDPSLARDIADKRRTKLREEVLARNASTTLEQLFSQIQEGEIKELNLIIKGDVQGSVGAIEASLEKLQNENVRVKIIHTGVGTINESDVMLAGTSKAVIIGFNVRPSAAVTTMAERDGIEIRTYRVIYDIIDDVEAAMKGMLDPEYKEVVLGSVEIRTTFKVPGVGIIGGAYVTDGKVVRNAQVRLVREGIVIHEGKISSLKRFKDDAKEVAQGFECGIGIENYNDLKEGDVIECFEMQEIER